MPEWVTASLRIVDHALAMWGDSRAERYIKKKYDLLIELSNEESKDVLSRDQNRIDHIHRELFFLFDLIANQLATIKRPNTFN